MNAKSIEKIEDILNYTFKNKSILREALTHKSYSSLAKKEKYNERLEFLGDSVLGCVVADYVFNNRPDFEEGRLSKIKSNLVSRKNVYHWADNINLGKYLYLSSAEVASGGRIRESILSNAMEAVLGAVYLDAGYVKVKKIILTWAENQDLEDFDDDFKSVLQEYIQKKNKSLPRYEVITTVGPEHDKVFTIEVYIDDKLLGKGKGKNKKSAQQNAAKNALSNLK
ncbi:MAG: ribonuclease III [Elusimicrobiaceae bacterium]|nr:ribonuclease III [Elusimicrobiaceae bacterium]MBT3955386.1 ribonuclease III [Elusimicrobiaceae bacterium]MBT4007663.1 ribonuclease III [Elusimicrobiaceae bacterium]MBT4402327.1 ribonuclease III [Elusimicrobiaceae bacterium]MBT4439560.1 ribonuclease III [Elusimicrobiaceae bacterium]